MLNHRLTLCSSYNMTSFTSRNTNSIFHHLAKRSLQLSSGLKSKASREQLSLYIQKAGSNVVYQSHKSQTRKLAAFSVMGAGAGAFCSYTGKLLADEVAVKKENTRGILYYISFYGVPLICVLAVSLVMFRIRSTVAKMNYLPKTDQIELHCETFLGLSHRKVQLPRRDFHWKPKIESGAQMYARVKGYRFPFSFSTQAQYNETVLLAL
ncbi:uncharacterized protein LOC142351871 isoform X1 [Convolutriloba macropyga]|uniref:uncharacterized protein LOC142351871 isoform X1 n=1 Tax=Convolutriloba macropyga TaxID=536237 RepID=UPI003F52757B